MATLRIQAPDGKFLRVDVTGHDPAEYDQLATAAVQDYTSTQGHIPIPADVENEPGLQSGPEVYTKPIGTLTKAGLSGLADIANPEQAAKNVSDVEAGQTPSTVAGKIGEAVGSLVTPEQIALQGGIGAFLEGSGIGQWAAGILKGWSESAAITAVGIVKNIAKGIGLDNLPVLAQFLMAPVQIGEKTFPAIVTATSDTKDMLAAAQVIQKAAGQALEKVNPVIDKALQAHPEAIDLKAILESLDKMKLAVEETAPNLGKAVVAQYNAAIDDFIQVVQKSTLEENPSLFSDLRNLKTTIGDLVYKHGNPLESKAALEDAYFALSNGIDSAAQVADKATGAIFAEANAVYNKITAVVEALSGKAISAAARGFFNDVPALMAGTVAATLHGPLGVLTGPAAFLGTKMLENYGPQAIAQGLNTASSLISPTINAVARTVGAAIPPIAAAISGQ